MVVGPNKRWGTWEELILGGAVLRHGTDDWNVVASELKARTINPNSFTPEACKARYERLRKRYTGCSFWFEELRKRRIEELKRELKRSEGSIGSLKTKIKSLKAERDLSSQTGLPVPVVKLEGIQLSAGSFTKTLQPNESHRCQVQALTSTTETESNSKNGGGMIRKRRGKRKRKDVVWDSKEGSIGESGNMCSTSGVSFSHSKEAFNDGCGDDETRRGVSGRTKNGGLMDIFNSIAQREPALVFMHRLDSQKRARYKKTIKRHMDMETIRSRIVTLSIRSPLELFRDLLLLANNAVIFYSKRTREHKVARALRDLITKTYHHMQAHNKDITTSVVPTVRSCAVKPRSARPRPSKHRSPAIVLETNTNAALLKENVGKEGGLIKQTPGKAKRVLLVNDNHVSRHRELGKEGSSSSLHKTVPKEEVVVVGSNMKPVVKKRKVFPSKG
ncbi:unnamed protein product [Cuscuta epithymum]|uniref:Bromo domain-containing protein n=1 Tax=Cuscuta epithymum TaxID=186058 RepID=A0AAV0CS47_9ASTE|nr:unnamed protein product [Cuscuta epithymum]